MKLLSCIGLALASVAFALCFSAGVPRAAAGEVSQCGDPDFNNDGVVDGRDLEDFDRVSSGGDPCRRGGPEEPVEPVCCDSIDFNGNGVYPEDEDRTAFLIVLAGGPCPLDGWTPIRQTGPVVRVGPGESIAAVYRRLQWSGGIVEIPWASRPGGVYEEAIRWPDQESLPYGSVAFVGLPGPDGQRPTIRPPSGQRGVLINASNIRISGVHFKASGSAVVVDVQGDVTGILIEDCIIEGGQIGVRVEGNTTPAATVRVRRNIVVDQVSPPPPAENAHSQGFYIATAHTFVAEENVLINTGSRNDKCHGMYLVHNAACQRIITGNWIIGPGSAGIQARGGTYWIDRNVVALANTGIGTGHPMAWHPTDASRTVWTQGTVANTVIADAREREPAQWGGCYMLGGPPGKMTMWRDNLIIGVARPWMSSVDQGGAAARVPIGDVRKVGNTVKMQRSGVNWEAKARQLRGRKSGVWDAAAMDVDALRVRLAG